MSNSERVEAAEPPVVKALVVHCRREPYDVYIGRPSKWGNPFHVVSESRPTRLGMTRDEAIAAYAKWIKTQPELMAALPELRDKVLGCWCAPYRCHGEVLVALASDSSGSR